MSSSSRLRPLYASASSASASTAVAGATTAAARSWSSLATDAGTAGFSRRAPPRCVAPLAWTFTTSTATATARRFLGSKSRSKKQKRLQKRQPPPPPGQTVAPSNRIVITQTKAADTTSASGTIAAADDDDDGIHIRPSPDSDPQEGEDEFVSRFALPDRAKEQELSTIQNQVAELYHQGQYQQGLVAAKTLLQKSQDHFGSHSHPATASAHLNLGLLYKTMGDFALARKHYQSARQSYQRTVGIDHASYAAVLHNLGLLNVAQLHTDAGIGAMARIEMLTDAMEHLEQALAIRRVELPPQHPLTVATQSALGMALAAHILHQHKQIQTKNRRNSTKFVPLLPADVTQHGWDAAHQHLQQAFQSSLENPKGESCFKLDDPRHYQNVMPATTKNHSKQEDDNSNRNQQQQNATTPPVLQTLSAATAAQNLAVFLKARAATMTDQSDHTRAANKWIQQAHDLYQDVLKVRTMLLPKGHADIYMTQYSLAEWYQAQGEQEAAQALRQVIIDTYDPPTTTATTTARKEA